MTAKYHLVAHPELQAQLRELHAQAQRDPSGPEAMQFAAIRTGLAALRTGREADFDGERLGYSDRHPDLRDCAEIKLSVVAEVNRRGRPMGPSHRLIYREFDGPGADHLPVRQVMAFEPRKDGRPFEVAANRLGRTRGAPLAELDSLPNVEPAVGSAKDPSRPVTPVRRPLPPDLAKALAAASDVAPAAGATSSPSAPTLRPPPPGKQGNSPPNLAR